MSVTRNAADLYLRAEKLSKSWFNAEENAETAIEMFTKAAHLFQLSGKLDEAIDAYGKAMKLAYKYTEYPVLMDIYEKLAKIHEHRLNYTLAIECRQQIVDLLMKATSQTHHHVHIRNMIAIAGLYEKLEDYVSAILNYHEALTIMAVDDHKGSLITTTFKIAQLMAMHTKDYDGAIKHYMSIITQFVDGSLQFKSLEAIFLALLCSLCADGRRLTHQTKEMMNEFLETNYMFDNSLTHHLIEDLIHAIMVDDLELFTTKLTEYDQRKRLTSYEVYLLSEIKKTHFSDAIDTANDSDEDIL